MKRSVLEALMMPPTGDVIGAVCAVIGFEREAVEYAVIKKDNLRAELRIEVDLVDTEWQPTYVIGFDEILEMEDWECRALMGAMYDRPTEAQIETAAYRAANPAWAVTKLAKQFRLAMEAIDAYVDYLAKEIDTPKHYFASDVKSGDVLRQMQSPFMARVARQRITRAQYVAQIIGLYS